jgi:defect-in-organelle-trafficking protein DotD
MRYQRLRLAGTLTGLALLVGCAGHTVTTDIETTGMPNPEVALRRSMDQVNSQVSQLGGMRPSPQSLAYATTTPATAAVPIATAPVASTPATAAAVAIPAFPPPANTGPVVPEELQRPIAFAWNGPLDDGVRKVAAELGYRVDVSGPLNTQPVAVVVAPVSTTLVGAFTALGNQAGSAATVRLDFINRRVEVIHHV